MEKNPLTNIMVVEDEEDIRIILKFSLEKIGNFTVKFCSSGKEALNAVEEFHPQMILLDMMMPEMDGRATLQALKALPQLSKTLFVFMTAKMQTDIEEYQSLGAVAVVSKPFSPKDLPNILHRIWDEN